MGNEFQAGVLAVCGGPEHLERTPAVADVIMHARIFYYKSKTGIAIPAIGYKDWLRGKGYSRVKPKEWDILGLMCDKRDSNYAKKFGLPKYQPSIKDEAAMVAWLVTIYGDNIDIPLRPPYRSPNSRGQPQLQSQIESQPMATGNNDTLQSQHEQQPTPSAPIWQTAAPKGELYVDRSKAPAEENGKDQSPDAPYPIRFAQIIEAVQTGQPVDGIQEIPDTVARNAVSVESPSSLRSIADSYTGYSPVRQHDCP